MISSKMGIWDREIQPSGGLMRTTAQGCGQRVSALCKQSCETPCLHGCQKNVPLVFLTVSFPVSRTLSSFLCLKDAVKTNGWTESSYKALYLLYLPSPSLPHPSNRTAVSRGSPGLPQDNVALL